jgi:hypothetical protein
LARTAHFTFDLEIGTARIANATAIYRQSVACAVFAQSRNHGLVGDSGPLQFVGEDVGHHLKNTCDEMQRFDVFVTELNSKLFC